MSQDVNPAKKGEFLPQIRSIALIALGSNCPFGSVDVKQAIRMGMNACGADLGVIRAESRFFKTPAYPPGAGPDFVNAALELETSCTAQELIAGLHVVEASLGRDRRTRWGPRTLDLDLIAFDDLVVPDRETFLHWAGLPLEKQVKLAPEQLILPHPRLADRAFVLVPLLDIAPDWVHPVTGRSVRQMASDLPPESISEIVAL